MVLVVHVVVPEVLPGYPHGNVHDVKSSISPFGPGTNVTDPKSYSYTKSQAESIGAGIGSGVGATGDLGGSKGAGYSGSKGIGLGFGRSEGVDPSQSSQTGAQTSHSGQGISFSDDAATSSDSSTYICTALYEMGDMKKYTSILQPQCAQREQEQRSPPAQISGGTTQSRQHQAAVYHKSTPKGTA